ncbi:MAG TPA: hypothetical protein ENG66_08415 [Thermococcus sp.]|nr:hypothetical protein [Thermococcus sp.]
MSLNTFMKTVKEKLDLREVVEYTGIKLPNWRNKKQILIRCPFHDDTNPSLALYHDHFYCFGCRMFGDHLTWLQKYQGLSFNDAIKTLSQLADIPYSLEFEKRKASKSLDLPTIRDIVEKAHAKLLELFEDYTLEHWFIDRGFAKNEEEAISFAKKYRLGVWLDRDNFPEFYGHLIIPYFNENGEVVWFNARNLTGVGSKYRNAGGGTHVYNVQVKDMILEKGYVLVVEGELDTISALEATKGSIPIIGVPGGGWGSEVIRDFFKDLARNNVEFYILMDPDEAGCRHAENLKRMIRDFGGFSEVVQLITPENHFYTGDINDALKEFGKETLSQMIDDILERYLSIGDVWFIKHLPALVEERSKRPVYPTGIEEIDELLGGGYREGLHIIGGITSAGKTSLALRIAVNNAFEKRPVLYITYEMSQLELWARIISALVKDVSYLDIKQGNLPKNFRSLAGWENIEKIAEYLKIVEGDCGMINQYTTLYTVEEIEAEAKKIKIRSGIAPLVIVDYIQRMPANEELKRKDIRERIDFIISSLQTRVARGIGCPVIALSSVSRSSYEVKEDTGIERKLSAFKESGGIEFTGYTVALLWQDTKAEEAEGVEENEHIIVFEVLKNRENGRIGQVKFRFNYKLNTWEVIG